MVQKRAGFGLEEVGKIAASISQAEQLQNPSKQLHMQPFPFIHTHTHGIIISFLFDH